MSDSGRMKPVTIVSFGILALVGFIILQRATTPQEPKFRTLTPAEIARRDADAVRHLVDSTVREIKWACQEQVRGRLKAPKTAEFDNVVAGLSTKDSGKVVVVGKVTAQNSFGAKLTNDFGCQYDRASRTWDQVVVDQ